MRGPLGEHDLQAIEAIASEAPANAAAMRVHDLVAEVRRLSAANTDLAEGYLKAEGAYRGVCTTMAEGGREIESLRDQIDRLANWIMANVPGEPSQSEGAVDTAIRLLGQRFL